MAREESFCPRLLEVRAAAGRFELNTIDARGGLAALQQADVGLGLAVRHLREASPEGDPEVSRVVEAYDGLRSALAGLPEDVSVRNGLGELVPYLQQVYEGVADAYVSAGCGTTPSPTGAPTAAPSGDPGSAA